jgi:hypothetical protein
MATGGGARFVAQPPCNFASRLFAACLVYRGLGTRRTRRGFMLSVAARGVRCHTY